MASFIMAVYNGEKFVGASVSSLLSQTVPQIELIIVDDCSTDNTVQILLSFQDSRVRIVTNKENLGLTASLNIALATASGKYIFRMDADDLALPARTQEQLATLTAANADICFGRGYFTQVDNKRTMLWRERPWSTTAWRGLFENRYGLHSSVAFRRDAIARVGNYDPLFVRAQDYDLWERCARHGLKFVYVKKPLIHYFLHSGGISINHRQEQEAYARQISFRALSKLLPSVGPDVLQGLRWLFLEREDASDHGSIAAGISHCVALADSFLTVNSDIDSGEIWADVASRCIARRSQVPAAQKRELLRTTLLAALRSRSPLVLLRVSRAALNAATLTTKKAFQAQNVR